jgi:hypothetical protein
MLSMLSDAIAIKWRRGTELLALIKSHVAVKSRYLDIQDVSLDDFLKRSENNRRTFKIISPTYVLGTNNS